ncbi:helix-turn-helix domain-containing protein [Metabacillus litoralis]|uniref:helix-turn-helix domain-containing protein n=1 Tax=Metabacillus TaxID=2675233 RepID=UPI000EF5C185|nr:helix-turn-helix domain-containing protein [Metabacillus litoralis]MCM3412423.1 helix-turn-helix domain-containing protein [Metabacillus litoralis]UHA57882.1 helix-turn-helix domain-containing protein [Metabacillus litoralis]
MLGDLICNRRKQKGLTLSEVAKRAKVSKSYLSNIERNLNLNPSLQVVGRIATVLDVDINVLLNPGKKIRLQQQDIDPVLIELATTLKESGIDKEEIKEYKTLIEFIQWRKQKK